MFRRLPKLLGADVELGNFIAGVSHADGTGDVASRLLLREFDGVRVWQSSGFTDPQDWGRRFLPANGGCAYVDLDHCEICLPETLAAHDFVACWHAMLRMVRQAQEKANAKIKQGLTIQVIVNNTDFHGNSFGSHLNFLIARDLWNAMFQTRLQLLLLLASFQASSIVYAGQGKTGAEHGPEQVAYQISQRADYLHTLVGPQTTFNRPMVNSRDESLCGISDSLGMARLHVIFYDSNLSHHANLLKTGAMQILLAMLEAGWFSSRVLLYDPLSAVKEWSRDPSLERRAPLLDGAHVSAVEHQWMFFEAASQFVESGDCGGLVPGASEIVRAWGETLSLLETRDFVRLAGRLDWVLKLSVLMRAIEQHPELDFDSPEIRHLDLAYANLDPAEGLYWAFEESGIVEKLVEDSQIERFTKEPPEDTRAWTRAMLLRLAGSDVIQSVDWDRIRWRPLGHSVWSPSRELSLANPLGLTRCEAEPIFRDGECSQDVFAALEELANSNNNSNQADEPVVETGWRDPH